MNARAREIDFGVLGADEAAMLPKDRYQEKEEDFLFVSLTLALGYRRRMDREKPGSPAYRDEERALEAARSCAAAHYDNLRSRGYTLPAELVAALKRERL